MDTQIQKVNRPYYKKIYTDILEKKYPEKKEDCKMFLDKDYLSVCDIIELNRKIFGSQDKDAEDFNQKHRSYSPADILEILNYQENNSLNNTQLAEQFKLSRNTVAKWKKIFINQLT